MNLFTRLRGALKANATLQAVPVLPLTYIKFHLSEAHRVIHLKEYSQALFHCEEALAYDPTNVEASRLHSFIRQEWQEYVGVTEDSLSSFLWRGKQAATR